MEPANFNIPKYHLIHVQFNDDCMACHAVKKCEKSHFSNPSHKQIQIHELFQRAVREVMVSGAIIWDRQKFDSWAFARGLTIEQSVIFKSVLNKRFNFNIELDIPNDINFYNRKSDKMCLNHFHLTEDCFKSNAFRHELGIEELPEKEELLSVKVDYLSAKEVEKLSKMTCLEDSSEEEELFIVLF